MERRARPISPSRIVGWISLAFLFACLRWPSLAVPAFNDELLAAQLAVVPLTILGLIVLVVSYRRDGFGWYHLVFLAVAWIAATQVVGLRYLFQTERGVVYQRLPDGRWRRQPAGLPFSEIVESVKDKPQVSFEPE